MVETEHGFGLGATGQRLFIMAWPILKAWLALARQRKSG